VFAIASFSLALVFEAAAAPIPLHSEYRASDGLDHGGFAIASADTPAQGAASTGTMRGLLAQSTPEECAGLLSTIYLISCCGAALSAMVAGEMAHFSGLAQVAEAYERHASGRNWPD